MPGGMTIGQLAKAARVNVETIRYYQRRGLLPTPSRPSGGQRRYPPSVLRQIAFIRRAQYLGFTLEEIGELLQSSASAKASQGRAYAQAKWEELGTRVAEINRIRRDLRALIDRSDKQKPGEPSVFFAALYGEGDQRAGEGDDEEGKR